MTRLHTDLSRVPVSVAPSPATSGTSLGVTDANAAYLPDTYPYWAVLVPTGVAPTRSNSEIAKVTGGSSSGGTTTLTIVRAQGIPVTTAQTVTTSFDIYDANSSEANIGLNSLIINETPSGTVNGSNAAFDTASTYIAGSIQVYRDGQLMKGGGDDYTETDSNTITFTTAPATGSVLLVTYQHIVSTTGNADTLDGYHANATPTANNIPVLNASKDLDLDTGDVIATDVTAEGVMRVAGAITQTGTADHVTITPGTSKLVKIAVLEQGNTTDTYRNNAIILTGWGLKNGNGVGTWYMQETVTFGVTFSTTPIVVCNSAGRDNTPGSGALGSSWNTYNVTNPAAITESQFTATVFLTTGTGTMGNYDYIYTWIAIGTLT